MCDRQLMRLAEVEATRAKRRRPVAIDLFAGAGGLALGFEQAGFDVVAAVEIDPIHVLTHKYNFPHTEVLCQDIATLSGDDLRSAARLGYQRFYPGVKWDGVIDAVIGGPPCQGFSTGGVRDESDARNQMLLEFVRVVEEIRPKTLCLENVAGLLEPRFDQIRQAAFKRLSNMGYLLTGTDAAINAVDYGVAQSRKRVIVLGALLSQPEPPRPATGERRTVRHAFRGLPSQLSEGSPSTDVLLLDAQPEAPDAAADECPDVVMRDNQGKGWPRLTSVGGSGGFRPTSHAPHVVERFANTDPGSVEPVSHYYRLSFDKPARTLRAGSGKDRGSHTAPRPIHPTEDRVITVREAARLHGYPDWFGFHATNWHGHRQVGNSVPPPLAKAAAQSLATALGATPIRPSRALRLGDPSLLTRTHTSASALLERKAEHADSELISPS